jgi:hypothetical protein
MEAWANFLNLVTIALIVYRHWVAAAGRLRLLYWLMVVGGIVGFVANALVTLIVPSVWSILGYCGLMLWTILMGVKGLARLRKSS